MMGDWILCKEKLPDSDGYYIVSMKLKYCTDPKYWVGVLFYETEVRTDCCWTLEEYDDGIPYGIDEVLAWMPLPEPYKEEK